MHPTAHRTLRLTVCSCAALVLGFQGPARADDTATTGGGALIYRVYLPSGSPQSVPLPSVTISYNDGRPSRTVAPCATGETATRDTSGSARSSCAWGLVVSGAQTADGHPVGLNVFYPDTTSTYWVTFFPADSAQTITVNGVYPDARYMSFNAYNMTGSSYTVNGKDSGLADSVIAPDAGSINPWQQAGAAGGHFTVKLLAAPPSDEVNTLPLPPAPDGSTSSASLPLPCTGQACPPLDTFVRIDSGGLYPNVDNAYVSALHVPQAGQVLVIRGKLPSTVDGTHPQPWPAGDTAMRYWSVCNNVYLPPYPVLGCADDDHVPVDAQGHYTIVTSAPADRPRNATTEQGVVWLANATWLPTARHLVLIRNMLPNGFAPAVQNVPVNSSPAVKRSIMQAYYPRAWVCSTRRFEQGGWQACQAGG